MKTKTMQLTINEDIATITFNARQGINKINQAFRDEFVTLIKKVKRKSRSLRGVILTSAHSEFVVGADLDEITQLAGTDMDQVFTQVACLNQSLRTLETLGKPVVAMINGSALGGGYEICLACHYRIACENESARIGLPEAQLGLMPGAGGTVRLPKLIGTEASLPLIMEGKTLRFQQALALGMIDELVASTEAMEQAAIAYIESASSVQRWDQKGYRAPGGLLNSPKSMMKVAIAPAMLRKKTQGRYPAPEAILGSVINAGQVSFDAALAYEQNAFCALLEHPVCKSMVNTFWHQLNQIKKGGARPAGISTDKVTRVGVIGAGMMGAGIAYVCAKAGVHTILIDVDIAKAKRGKAYAESILDRKQQKGAITDADKTALLDLILPSDDINVLAGSDLIIEAVFENAELKAKINATASAQLTQTGIMASNTSSLPISQLAKSALDAERFIGLHFFSPVDKMPLVEIIKGNQTSAETLAKAFDFVQQINKTPIVVNDSRGFFTSRVFGTYVTEGMALLQEGVPAQIIENAAKYLAMPVSPLAVSDEVSISLARHIRDEARKAAEKNRTDFVAHPADDVIEAMLDKFNRPGKAAGKGFYDYLETGKKQLWPGLSAFEKPHNLSFTAVQERLLFIQAIEAIRCFEEGVIESVADANIGSIMGIGFAPWTGGVLEYVNQCGVNAFYQRALMFAESYGERFSPPALLATMANNNERF